MEVTVVEGDITTQDVDAVVNAANRRMRGGGGVDGAIHAAGGPEVLEDCRRRFPDGLATGAAGWTTAGRMPARWVIHVVGPNWTAGERDRSLLESCYSGALAVADELGARTVAFPLVSAGIYGWPRRRRDREQRSTRCARRRRRWRRPASWRSAGRLTTRSAPWSGPDVAAQVEVVKPSLTKCGRTSSHFDLTGLR